MRPATPTELAARGTCDRAARDLQLRHARSDARGTGNRSSPCSATRPHAATDDPFEGAVEVFNFGFEQDEDRDFDRHPDGWIRRKGPDFPRYIEGSIDPEHGHGGKGASLCFKANGGRITMYSKPIVIDPYHSYFFRGYVRTQMLENDAALVSISLLNHKRQRVQRFLTRPITGTFKDWSLVTIGPIVPHEDVHFVAIGCHLGPQGSRLEDSRCGLVQVTCGWVNCPSFRSTAIFRRISASMIRPWWHHFSTSTASTGGDLSIRHCRRRRIWASESPATAFDPMSRKRSAPEWGSRIHDATKL